MSRFIVNQVEIINKDAIVRIYISNTEDRYHVCADLVTQKTVSLCDYRERTKAIEALHKMLRDELNSNSDFYYITE